MIAFIAAAWNWTADTARFASAVWHDARVMQEEAEEKYGCLGF